LVSLVEIGGRVLNTEVVKISHRLIVGLFVTMSLIYLIII